MPGVLVEELLQLQRRRALPGLAWIQRRIREAALERVEDLTRVRDPSISSTGNVPRSEKAIARGPPGSSERRTCGTRLKSSAQRAFSLKFEKLYCHRTGADTAMAIIETASAPGGHGVRLGKIAR